MKHILHKSYFQLSVGQHVNSLNICVEFLFWPHANPDNVYSLNPQVKLAHLNKNPHDLEFCEIFIQVKNSNIYKYIY